MTCYHKLNWEILTPIAQVKRLHHFQEYFQFDDHKQIVIKKSRMNLILNTYVIIFYDISLFK